MTGPDTIASLPGADRTPEDRGLRRDGVRLLVSDPGGESHHRIVDLPGILASGDLLVVNESGTLAASLPARSHLGEFRVSVSTRYGEDLWLVEARRSFATPGPLPLGPGDAMEIGGVPARYLAHYPGIRRLGFVRTYGDLRAAMGRVGQPIRYGYLARSYPLDTYQTTFARRPGSAEMPSAARPFTPPLVERLRDAGVALASIVLHCGVSSLEPEDAGPGTPPLFPEPFEVPAATVAAVRAARARGGRVIALGTTVVRALESATDACGLRPALGFTRVYLHPGRPARSVDGVLTGFHESSSTHLDLLRAVVGADRLVRAYQVASEGRYLGHEFGDSHLFLRDRGPGPAAA